MRWITLVVILLAGAVTQSCKITAPSLLELIGKRLRVYDLKSKAIALRGGFRDTLTIGDNPESSHGKLMQRYIVYHAGISEENTVFFSRFGYSGGWRRPINMGLPELMLQQQEKLRLATRVAHLPVLLPLKSREDLPAIQANNILFVVGAGNVKESWNGDRDLYNINNARWSHDDPYRNRLYKESYQAVLEIRNTGKVISATSSVLTETGEIEPGLGVVKCGDIKKSCFTITPETGTSATSAYLAAMSFYLAQFWETPEEIVKVLNECAVDVGEPGIDREYGRGVANLLCPRTLKKEIEVVSKYLEEQKRYSVLKEESLQEAGLLKIRYCKCTCLKRSKRHCRPSTAVR